MFAFVLYDPSPDLFLDFTLKPTLWPTPEPTPNFTPGPTPINVDYQTLFLNPNPPPPFPPLESRSVYYS